MSRHSPPPIESLDNGVRYEGAITTVEKSDGSYYVDFGPLYRLSIADLNDPIELDNPYFRDPFIALRDGSGLNPIPYVSPEPPEVLPHYNIWDLVPDDHKTETNTEPTYINYKTGLVQRLHPRVWLVHGLVVQIVYYKDYDGTTFSNPIVREVWEWELDPSTNFVQKRTIDICWYGTDATTEEGEVKILEGCKHLVKWPSNSSDQIQEIQRRRTNVVNNLFNQVIQFIAGTVTIPSVAVDPSNPTPEELNLASGQAIALGQDFMDTAAAEVTSFKEHGSDVLANKLIAPESSTEHTWLGNDLTMLGIPETTIAQFAYAELTADISDTLDNFDMDSIAIDQ